MHKAINKIMLQVHKNVTLSESEIHHIMVLLQSESIRVKLGTGLLL